MGDSPFAITVQAVGTLMVAALLWQLTRLIPGRFLRYWSIAWVCLTVALFALRMAKADHLPDRRIGFVCFLLGEYCFGFLLWAGFRDYARNRALALKDFRVFLVLLPFALAVPWLGEEWLLPLHTAVMAAFFAAAFRASLSVKPRITRPPVGLNIVRVILLGLAIIFALYGPLLTGARIIEPLEWQYFRLSPVYYALIELGLAFGLVVLASERAQEVLEEKNQQLSEASRRDALTGLFNRRHFDEILAEHTGHAQHGAIGVIDVNDLKKINDNHLHTTGDAVLKLVARALVSKFRVTDPTFRTGGDEFAVLMPGASEADLAARLADIDDSLVNLRVPGLAEPMDIRIAWGTAAYTHGREIAAGFEAADKAMYSCKNRRKTKHDTD